MLEDLALPAGKPCKTAQKIAELSPEDQKILLDALENPRWSTHALRRELTQRGFIISDTSFRGHRNKECSCVRES